MVYGERLSRPYEVPKRQTRWETRDALAPEMICVNRKKLNTALQKNQLYVVQTSNTRCPRVMQWRKARKSLATPGPANQLPITKELISLSSS
jgi:hypothetical protein